MLEKRNQKEKNSTKTESYNLGKSLDNMDFYALKIEKVKWLTSSHYNFIYCKRCDVDANISDLCYDIAFSI